MEFKITINNVLTRIQYPQEYGLINIGNILIDREHVFTRNIPIILILRAIINKQITILTNNITI